MITAQELRTFADWLEGEGITGYIDNKTIQRFLDEPEHFDEDGDDAL